MLLMVVNVTCNLGMEDKTRYHFIFYAKMSRIVVFWISYHRILFEVIFGKWPAIKVTKTQIYFFSKH